jgi:hypothetical protein
VFEAILWGERWKILILRLYCGRCNVDIHEIQMFG